jgi:hypothetical protein
MCNDFEKVMESGFYLKIRFRILRFSMKKRDLRNIHIRYPWCTKSCILTKTSKKSFRKNTHKVVSSIPGSGSLRILEVVIYGTNGIQIVIYKKKQQARKSFLLLYLYLFVTEIYRHL